MIHIDNRAVSMHGGRLTAYAKVQPGSDRVVGASQPRRSVETAAGPSQSMSAAGASNQSNGDGFLTGIFPDSGSLLLKAVRDCYTYDAISGTAVDLFSSLPFGGFDLYGVSEDKLEVYQSAIANLNMRSAAEPITRQFLVDGTFCSTLVFDAKSTAFVDQIPYDSENLKLDWPPLISQDPVITAKASPKFKDLLGQSSNEHQRILKLIPPAHLNALKGGDFVLDPLSTLFMSRRPFMTSEPTSFLKRVLPAYLIEKTLYRGTVFEAGRRQRANVHVTAGDDSWEATPEELAAIANIFQQTDLDPMGAIVVTRNGINVNDFRQAGDFWKWTDVFDTLTTIKLKALGISDAFLSSESSYNNSENALVVFMETLNSFRDFFTHTIFTNKLFPLIAMVKGYHLSKKETAASYTVNVRRVNDYSQLEIPKVRWQKRLVAGNDQNLFEILEKLGEKGIPVPMRLWIAASGMDAATLLNELEDDERLQQRFSKFKDSSGGDEGGGMGDLDSLMESASMKPPLHWSKREFGKLSDAHTEDSQGRRHFAMNQTLANRKINETIAKSVQNLANPENYRKAKNRVRIIR